MNYLESKIKRLRNQTIYNGKIKCLLENGVVIKVPATDKPTDGGIVTYTEHKKGDKWENEVTGEKGTYENDFKRFEFYTPGLTNARREELQFTHNLHNDEA